MLISAVFRFQIKRACELMNALLGLQDEIIVVCDRVCQEALQGDGGRLSSSTRDLEDKVCWGISYRCEEGGMNNSSFVDLS